jgi:nitrogen fixation protein FixH
MKALVIIVTIIGLSAVIGSLIVGKAVFDGKVVDKPYETGLLYDEIEKAKKELRFEVLNKELKTGKNEVLFTLKDHLDRPITDPQMVFMISRPSTTRYDREFQFSYAGEGRYKAEVYFPLHGYWDIRLKLLRDWKPVVIEKRVYVNLR